MVSHVLMEGGSNVALHKYYYTIDIPLHVAICLYTIGILKCHLVNSICIIIKHHALRLWPNVFIMRLHAL